MERKDSTVTSVRKRKSTSDKSCETVGSLLTSKESDVRDRRIVPNLLPGSSDKHDRELTDRTESKLTHSEAESVKMKDVSKMKFYESGDSSRRKGHMNLSQTSVSPSNVGSCLVTKDENIHAEPELKAEKIIDVCSERSKMVTASTRSYYFCLFLFTFASLLTRFFKIELPEHVCWDETHFGKMGSWYINRTFFFDVHPPLGKMLIGLAGYMTGYEGSFPFAKPGDDYGDTHYVGMRMFCAVLGASLIPLSFQIVWLLTHSLLAASLGAAFILFDTGTNTLSRYILLDPILLFFIMAATYCNLNFQAHRNQPFTSCWWFWLGVTGLSLAGALGVKFVGLFIILLVGIWTVWDLKKLFADLTLPIILVVKHLFARAVCLILVPVICYFLFFYIHFQVLNHSGNGDGFFSSAFQSQLIGNKLYNVSMPQHVAYGSLITLKQRRTGGAYLHSHSHLYPEEHPPRQQQVTTYSHKDDNNLWKIKPADREVNSSEPVTLIRNGDLIRLEHVATRRNLHSHREPAPLTKRHFQVSGYGMNGSGDANDVWLVELIGIPQGEPLQTVRSKIRLIHYYVRCALFSHDKKLPKWGWEQLETTCTTNVRDHRAQWSVEEVQDHRLPNVSFEVYSPSFIEKIIESHAVMTQGNSGLKPKEGEITSKPWQWPINYKGQIFSGKDHRVYLLGNPVLFWAALLLKGVFFFCFIVHKVRKKRGMEMDPTLLEYTDKMFSCAWWMLLGWGLHYLPFWCMSRVLYFHHYFPAFLFSAMFCGIVLDYLVTKLCLAVPEGLAKYAFYWSVVSIMGIIAYSFYLFHPLTYGMHGTVPSAEGGMMYGLHWLESWDF